MQSAVESAMGLPRRSTRASRMLAFLIPADVRRSFTRPPGSERWTATPVWTRTGRQNHRSWNEQAAADARRPYLGEVTFTHVSKGGCGAREIAHVVRAPGPDRRRHHRGPRPGGVRG